MNNLFSPNIIVCPSCGKDFEYNKVNGIALMEVVSALEARKRMYIRLTLDNIERQLRKEGAAVIDYASLKKTILDNMNDYSRDVNSILGFGVDAE
jgi:hypothetical protein